MEEKKRNILKKMASCVLLVFVAIVFVNLVCVVYAEVLTRKYGKQFEGKENSMISEVDFLKVLEYDDDNAKVYYISKGGSGNIVYFEKEDNVWKESRWETVWSAGGSASEMAWPYWWYGIKYGNVIS